jgi:hypothetical protein
VPALRLKRFFSFLLFILAFTAIAVYLFAEKEAIMKTKLRTGLSSMTMADVAFDGLRVSRAPGYGPLTLRVRIIEIRFANPPGYRIPNMATIKNAEIIFEPLPLFWGKWDIWKASGYLNRVGFQYNASGKLNIAGVPAVSPGVLKNHFPEGRFRIRRLEMILGKLYYLDFRRDIPARERHDFSRSVVAYENVTSPYVPIQALVLEMIKKLNKGSLDLPSRKIQKYVSTHASKV